MISEIELRRKYDLVARESEGVLERLLQDLQDFLSGIKYIDTPSGRIKSKESFVAKVLRDPTKYDPPFVRIEDFIGLRVPVYFRDTAEDLFHKIKEEYAANVEDSHKQYGSGYEGFHLIQSIPSSFLPHRRNIGEFPQVFEMQIRTLYVHAWAQPEHLFRYKNAVAKEEIPEHIMRKIDDLAEMSREADNTLLYLRQWYESIS